MSTYVIECINMALNVAMTGILGGISVLVVRIYLKVCRPDGRNDECQ